MAKDKSGLIAALNEDIDTMADALAERILEAEDIIDAPVGAQKLSRDQRVQGFLAMVASGEEEILRHFDEEGARAGLDPFEPEDERNPEPYWLPKTVIDSFKARLKDLEGIRDDKGA